MKLSGTLLALLLFVPTFGWSQQEDTTETSTTAETTTATSTDAPKDESAQATKGGKVEKIQVTGSHIKRTDIEGPSPVLTLDRDYLQASGHNSAADILRETTVSVFGGQRETALNGGAQTGAALTTIRGSDSSDVLVLMDGKRMTAIGGGQEIDLNLIPLESIERIEILKDGASALYGSDALGGVINFITRRDYDGANVKIRYTAPEDGVGPRTDASAVYGKNYSKGNFLAVLQYRGNKEIASSDRDFAIATRPFFSPTSPTPAYKELSATSFSSPGCADPFPPGHPLAGRCRFNYSTFSWVVPKMEQYSALISARHEIGSQMNVFGRVNLTQRNVTSQLAPAPGGTVISQNTANTQWGLGVTEDILFVYRTVAEGGPRINNVDSLGINAVTGVGGYIGDSWDWEATASYSSSNTTNKQSSGYFNTEQIVALADSGGFNPFDATPDDLSSAALVGQREIFSDVFGVEAKFTGELFNLGEGPVSGAFGTGSNWITYDETGDAVTLAGNNWGGIAGEGNANRNFQFVYSEFGLNPLKNLEIQLAGRFDNFNDFGSSVNPKVAVRYKPLESLMFRGSWGTGFKAPSLEDLYGGGGNAFPFARDESLCQGTGGGDPNSESCAVTQFELRYQGNPNIKEEKSSFLNLGSIWEPLTDLSFSVDWFSNRKDNIAGLATARDILRAEERSDLGIGYLQGLGFDVVRSGGLIDYIQAPSTNIGRRNLEGIEFSAQQKIPVFGSWKVNWGVMHTQMLTFEIEPFPGFGLEDRLGWPGNPKWKNNVSVGLFNGTHNIRAMARTIDGQFKNETAPGCCGEIPIYTEYDLNYNFIGSWGGTIEFGVKNVANTNPPTDEFVYGPNGFLNTGLYNPLGRFYYLGYGHSF